MTEEQLKKLIKWLKEEEERLSVQLHLVKLLDFRLTKDYVMGRASQLRVVINQIHQLLQEE